MLASKWQVEGDNKIFESNERRRLNKALPWLHKFTTSN